MWPELFSIPVPGFLQTVLQLGPKIGIHSYGLIMVIAFFAAKELARLLARRRGLDRRLVGDAALLALFAGIVGGRALYLLENWSEYSRIVPLNARLLAMANVFSGGVTYYGGLLLAAAALTAYAVCKRIPVRVGIDIASPCLMIALGLGRIGCFANGCCYGARGDLPWAAQFVFGSKVYSDQFFKGELGPPPEFLQVDDSGKATLCSVDEAKAFCRLHGSPLPRSLPVYPLQIYSACAAFALCALLLAFERIPHIPGRVFALMCVLHGSSSYVLEMLRPAPKVLGGMTLGMLSSAALAIVGATLWFAFHAPSSTGEDEGKFAHGRR